MVSEIVSIISSLGCSWSNAFRGPGRWLSQAKRAKSKEGLTSASEDNWEGWRLDNAGPPAACWGAYVQQYHIMSFPEGPRIHIFNEFSQFLKASNYFPFFWYFVLNTVWATTLRAKQNMRATGLLLPGLGPEDKKQWFEKWAFKASFNNSRITSLTLG